MTLSGTMALPANLRLILDKDMVIMIIQLVLKRSFTLTSGESKQSKNLPSEKRHSSRISLAPLFFNNYTHDFASTISVKFANANDLAFLHSSGDWKNFEITLNQDMTILLAYFQTYRLKLNFSKMITAVYYFNDRDMS